MKKVLKVLPIFLFVLLLVSCSAGSYGKNNGAAGDNSDESGGSNETSIVLNSSNRKIIYTVNLSVKTNDLLDTTAELKDLLLTDEWVESENLSSNSNYLIFRVKTERLDTFVSNIRNEYETTNFRLESTDISIEYVNIESKIEALELERERLLVLYQSANINEMITINQRIGQIDSELINLNRNIAGYDSLIEYSKVIVWIYGPTANPNPPSYGTKLQRSFSNGWNAVVTFLESITRAIAFLIPFLIIAVPIGGFVVFMNYRSRKRNKKD